MIVLKRLKRLADSFRARDDAGRDFHVKVYVDVVSGVTAGGGTWEAEGPPTVLARPLTGPWAGLVLAADWTGGDAYRVTAGGRERTVVRVR
jgi:hypothetical protein